MKLSQARLKQIIQEEISKLDEAEAVLTHAKLKDKFFEMARKVSDLASNELDELTRLVRVMLLAYQTNVNTSDVKVALDMLERKLKSNDEYAKYFQAAPGEEEEEEAPLTPDEEDERFGNITIGGKPVLDIAREKARGTDRER